VCSREPADAAASRLWGPDVVVWGAAAATAVAAGGARHVRRLVQATQGAAALLLLQNMQKATVSATSGLATWMKELAVSGCICRIGAIQLQSTWQLPHRMEGRSTPKQCSKYRKGQASRL
jgi:hypothetical protein